MQDCIKNCLECFRLCTETAAHFETYVDPDGQMKRCAEACRRCAKTCAAMAT